MRLNDLRDECHGIAKEKGWYSDGDRNVGEALMLVVTEVAEAMEEVRVGRMGTYRDALTGKPEGFEIEIADILIRLFDLAGYLKIDLDEAVRQKIAYNRTRPVRHGGKLA